MVRGKVHVHHLRIGEDGLLIMMMINFGHFTDFALVEYTELLSNKKYALAII
jgi:hypothetical protein